VESRSRQALGAPCPGSDPAALRLITVAVLAGLVITGVVVVSHAQAPSGAVSPRHAGAQLRTGPGVMPGIGLSAAPAPQISFAPLAVPARGPAPALRLLSQAAVASRTVPYEGVEVLGGWAQAGQTTSVVRVWHTPGAVTLTQAVAPVSGWSGEVPHIVLPVASYGGQTMVGAALLGMSQRLVALLAKNYRVMAAGLGQVAGRPARVVVARRPGGRVAARFWLDRATRLPLRRETFDAAGHMVTNAGFVQVRLGLPVDRAVPATSARPWGNALAPEQLTALRAQGWPLPGPLPGNLALLDARQEVTPAGRVIDLDYSDGLCLVSVFVQRGHLPKRMTGWSEVVLGGHQVYADDSAGQGIAWSAHGFVYTVVAAAPVQTVGQVVAALPYDNNPGFFARLARGLHRLWTWLSP
jgi:sigma-E factor negative regulatory protein RseB